MCDAPLTVIITTKSAPTTLPQQPPSSTPLTSTEYVPSSLPLQRPVSQTHQTSTETTPAPHLNPNLPPLLPSSRQAPIHKMTIRAKNNIGKRVQKLNLSPHLSPSIDIESTIVTQALKDPKSHRAMFEEYNAPVQNGTWELVPSVSSQNIIG